MKTVTDVNTVNQLLTYSKQAEAGIHQKAIQMLLGAGKASGSAIPDVFWKGSE